MTLGLGMGIAAESGPITIRGDIEFFQLLEDLAQIHSNPQQL